MNEQQLITRAFLRGYKTGVESSGELKQPSVETRKHEAPTYKIGQVLEDGYLYAGFYQTDKESYHLAIAPKDEPHKMNWDVACKLDIPTKKEWNIISVNTEVFNFTNSYYWSSTEYNSTYAVFYVPQSGYSGGYDKTSNNLVRCVRRFGNSII